VNSDGSTGWSHSPLIQAAIDGDLLILDGVDRLDGDTLTVIHRLIVDREVDLFDGTRLRMTREDEETILVHPSFRVVALGCTRTRLDDGTITDASWLTNELLGMFSLHRLPNLQPVEQDALIRTCFPSAPKVFVESIMKFSAALSSGQLTGLAPLSTRQAIRLTR